MIYLVIYLIISIGVFFFAISDIQKDEDVTLKWFMISLLIGIFWPAVLIPWLTDNADKIIILKKQNKKDNDK